MCSCDRCLSQIEDEDVTSDEEMDDDDDEMDDEEDDDFRWMFSSSMSSNRKQRCLRMAWTFILTVIMSYIIVWVIKKKQKPTKTKRCLIPFFFIWHPFIESLALFGTLYICELRNCELIFVQMKIAGFWYKPMPACIKSLTSWIIESTVVSLKHVVSASSALCITKSRIRAVVH